MEEPMSGVVEQPAAPVVKMSDHVHNLAELLRESKAEEAKRLLTRVSGLLSAKDDSGRSTIHFAAVGGCLPILQFAISMHENVIDAKDDLGWTPLMIASSAGRTEIVRFLLTKPEVSVNHKNTNGQTPLHYAASKNHRQIAELLLQNGADINAADRLSATPLHRAASQGHEQMVRLLLSQPKIHIDAVNSEGNTALILACEENREDIAITLVMKGANIDKRNKDEKSALDMVQSSDLRLKLKNADKRAHGLQQ